MLQRRLILPAAAIALALSLALTGVGYWAGHTIVSGISDYLVRHIVDDIHRYVGTMTRRPQRVLSRVADDIARYTIPLDDPRAMQRELYVVLSEEPDVDWLYFASEAGGLVSTGRLADGARVFLMNDGFRPGVMREYDASPDGQLGQVRKSSAVFDPRQKLWYRQAKDTRARYWTEPYLGSGEPILGLSLSAPVLNKDGSFAGAIGIDLILTQLSREMQTLSLGDRADVHHRFTGRLIASGRGAAGGHERRGELQRPLAADTNDPVVQERRGISKRPDILRQLSGSGLRTFSFDDCAGRVTRPSKTSAPGGLSWTVVAAVPASDFLDRPNTPCFSRIAMSVLSSHWPWSWEPGLRALRPLTSLTEAARSIAGGQWRDVPEVQRNDEIGLLARAFKLMTASLKETQDGLRQSEENYRSIFENALEGIARTSFDGRLLSANPAFARMLGYALPEAMIAEPTDVREQLWVNPYARDAVLSTLLRDGAIVGAEAELSRRDGGRIWVSFSSRMARDGAGEPVFIETFLTEITERKRAEEALDHTRTELARVARVTTLGNLTASIAHEVNQPLAAVTANASACLLWLTSDTPDLGEARQAVERIVNDSRRAGDVIHRIRALVEKSPQRRDWLSVNDVITEVVALTRSEANRNRVLLQTELCDDLPSVKGDRIQLQQVILNLILNAIEAMSAVGEGPREVLASSARDGSQAVLVAVRDSGKAWIRAARPGLDAPLYDQADRHGHGAGDQPHDRQSPRRTAVAAATRHGAQSFSSLPVGGSHDRSAHRPPGHDQAGLSG
jgi:PAS domain S-box-containing protein